MVWVIAFGELFFGDLWCVVWGYGGMRTHFSLLNPQRVAGLKVTRFMTHELNSPAIFCHKPSHFQHLFDASSIPHPRFPD